MSYTNETSHYGIPLPLGSDLTTPMDYNSAFEAVDADLFDAKGTAQTANTTANDAKDAVTNITDNVIGGANGIDARLTAVEGAQTTQGTALTNLTNTVGDNKQDLMDAICSVAEASATATVQHLVGSYFWYNDTLYKTTVQINVSDTIVPNTNCQTTNITVEMLGLQPKTDNNLQTTSKEIVGAINELLGKVGANMPHLDFANPLHTFSSGNLTYTATKECYLFGILTPPSSGSSNITINSTVVGNSSQTGTVLERFTIASPLKLESGDIVVVTEASSLMHVFEEA